MQSMSVSRSALRPPLFFFAVLFVTALIAIIWSAQSLFGAAPTRVSVSKSKFDQTLLGSLRPLGSPVASSSASPTPTPRPYPPAGYHCVNLPILMYHHVEPLAQAASEGHAPLTVDSGVFASQMQYLVDRGYTTITLRDLANYFDTGKSLPKKAVILTFDDAYSDFHEYAVPILASHNFVSDLFVPTGLIENPGYATWATLKEDSGRGVSIDHHTWSHANVARADEVFFHREFDIATQQLIDHGYAPVDIFAYPYGTHNGRDVTELAKRGFRIAVTTLAGQTQCKEDRLLLHRTRIGNSSLKSYGL